MGASNFQTDVPGKDTRDDGLPWMKAPTTPSVTYESVSSGLKP